MKQFILDNLDWIIPCLLSLLSGSSLSAIISLVRMHFINRLYKKMMEDAKSRETMMICPKCKKKSPLSEVTFTLPSGEVDNNLNGVPDISEGN